MYRYRLTLFAGQSGVIVLIILLIYESAHAIGPAVRIPCLAGQQESLFCNIIVIYVPDHGIGPAVGILSLAGQWPTKSHCSDNIIDLCTGSRYWSCCRDSEPCWPTRSRSSDNIIDLCTAHAIGLL
jgi:hypothetical protein